MNQYYSNHGSPHYHYITHAEAKHFTYDTLKKAEHNMAKDIKRLDHCSKDGHYCDSWLNMHNYPITQEETTGLVCNTWRSGDRFVPPHTDYMKIEGDLDMAWGVAVSGGLIYNGVTDGMHDALYPKAYGNQHNVVSEHVDGCLMHPSHHGDLHYHSASSCIADPTSNPKATHD